MGSSSSKPKDLSEIVGKTGFSQQEIMDLYKVFKERHSSKSVNKEDFIKVYKEKYPDGDAEGFAKHVFRTYDADENGVIDFQEFVCGLSVVSLGNEEEKRHLAFRLMDEGDDGFISRKELMFLFAAYYRLKHNPAKLAMDRAVAKTDEVFTSLAKNNEDLLVLSYEDFKKVDISGILDELVSE